VLEAVIFATGEPVQPREIAEAFRGLDEETVERALDEISGEYGKGEGGLLLERVAGGYRLATQPRVGAWVRQYFRQRNRTRLSPAALETLAIVAYRQPVTSPEIQAIRGVDPSGALRSLLDKRMVRILGKKRVVGNPLLYGSTKQFLIHFGLNSLEDLPAIEDFEELVGDLGDDSLFAAESPEAAATETSTVEAPASEAATEQVAAKEANVPEATPDTDAGSGTAPQPRTD
jgi:segregation and condensation protein B